MKFSFSSTWIYKFCHEHRRLLTIMTPGWILSVLFILIVAKRCLAPATGSLDLGTFILVIFLGLVAIVTSIYNAYVYVFMCDIYVDNAERLQRLYLNGYSVWRYFDLRVFPRLCHYVGYDLCYEAAALEMMAWRGHEDVQYVFANVLDGKQGRRHDHSWIEVKYYGIWWVIDPFRDDPICIMPRWIYNLTHFTHYVRVFNTYSFWASSFTNEFYGRLDNRKTSFLFGKLGLFRRNMSNNKMYSDSLYINRLERSESIDAKTGYYFFKGKMPVSQEILAQFLNKPERLVPTLDAQERARNTISGMQMTLA